MPAETDNQDSKDGEAIVEMFRNMRRFCEEISRLLGTIDDEMSKSGWKPEDTTCTAHLSNSYKVPKQWIPIMAFRYYTSEAMSNKLAYVSVLFDDHFRSAYTIKEALITAGFFDYGTKKPEKDVNWGYHYFRIFGFFGSSEYLFNPQKIEPNGDIVYFNKDMFKKKLIGTSKYDETKLFEKGEVFALRLTKIKSPEDVKIQVTEKLLKQLNIVNT